MTELDNLVLDEVRKLKLDRPEEKQDNGLEKQIAKIDTQLSKLIDLYAGSDEMSKDVLSYKINALTERKRNLVEQLNSKKPDVSSLIRTFSDLIERANTEEMRAVLGELIDHIELDEDVTIVWKL